MTQAKLPALPQFSAVAPVRQPSAVRAADSEPDSGDRSFSKVLDRHLNSESPKSTAAPGGKDGPADEKSGAAREASTPDQQAASKASSHAPGVISKAALTAESAPAEAPAATPDQPQDGTATDPLQASLAGLPAALAALMGAAPSNPGAAPTPAGSAEVAANPAAGRDPRAALARLLGEAAGGRKDIAGTAATGNEEAAGEASAGDEDGAFATALDAASRPHDGQAVLSAVATSDTGPASRASDTAQAAANPDAGNASINANAAAAQGAAAPPVRMHQDENNLRLHIAQPTSHPDWAEAVGSRVTWLVGQHESKADLILTPPQLGRVEVSLTVNGDQTTAQFVAATPAAREALEQALPRLREVLAEAGINLAQSGVSTSDQQGARDQHSRPGTGRHADEGSLTGEIAPSGGPWRRVGTGLVDTFA